MPLFARSLALAAFVLPAAWSEEPACTGDDCGSAGEDAALIQIHRANASRAGTPSDFTNPCGSGTSWLPKQSTQKDCTAAGFQYKGNTDSDYEDSSNCCVKATWVCNLGTKKDCVPSGSANPTYLGTITWVSMKPRGNCCVPPNPAKSLQATWAFDTQLFPSKKKCQTKKVSSSCTIEAFWTGAKCMTTAKTNGAYKVPKCKKSFGKCKGLNLGGGMCCTC